MCKCGQSPAKARTGPVAPRKTRRVTPGSSSALSAPSPPGSQPWSPSYRIPEFLISRFPRLDSRLSGFPHSSETRAEPRNTRKARNRAGGSRNTRKTRKLPRPSLRDLGFFSVTSVTTDWSAFARNPELLISRFTRVVSRLSGFPHFPPHCLRALGLSLRDPCVPRVGLPHPGQRSDRHHTPQPGTDEHGPDFFRG